MWPLLLLTAAKVATVDFFGHEGVDLTAVRARLAVRIGDEVTPGLEKRIRTSVAEVKTVSLICCDKTGGYHVFVGLGGRAMEYGQAPTGSARVSARLLKMDQELDAAWFKSARTQSMTAVERKLAEMKPLALAEEPALLEAARTGARVKDRQVAAFLIGHVMEPNEERLAVLVQAARDADGTVRNNAVRGLGEWCVKHAEWRGRMPVEWLIGLLHSTQWTDLNKASYVLMSAVEEPSVRERLRGKAEGRLREMAAWASEGHAGPARIILEKLGERP